MFQEMPNFDTSLYLMTNLAASSFIRNRVYHLLQLLELSLANVVNDKQLRNCTRFIDKSSSRIQLPRLPNM